ncbi:alpha/beta fold hydrolase [Streptomyces sp. NPDC021020]|uniref:alpha/beta fold hydrolase n=1 Tax=Streptomyces sp. NPDC021020 TaxID=3365109 RepID=UPI00378AA2E1
MSADLRRTGAQAAIARLTASVLAVKPLVEGLAAPIRVVPAARQEGGPPTAWSADQHGVLRGVLERVAHQAGVRGLTPAADLSYDDLQVFERVVSHRLTLADAAGFLGDARGGIPQETDRIAAEAVADGFDAVFRKEVLLSSDGVPLNVYGSRRGGETVVLVPACGMPAALAEGWMRFLARDHRVVTWESRGLFGAGGRHGDYDVGVDAQAADLFSVLDHYGVARAHVVGLCGGAVIALAAASARPERIASLSLWHGAYEFVDGCPKTRHHQDLVELMAFASRSRAAALSVQHTICQMALADTPADVAHFVLYPFVNAEVFYRYCRVNGSLATTDVGQYLRRVTQPVLLVTSEDDETAHPQSSVLVADGLPNARLRVEPHGDHISLFGADDALMRVASDFIAEQSAEHPAGPLTDPPGTGPLSRTEDSDRPRPEERP